MKLNILWGDPGAVRSGYVNVDPLGSGPGVVVCQPHELSSVADANECEEIVAIDVLDRYGPDRADGVLSHWLSLLRHGGRLTVSALDLGEVCRAHLGGRLGVDEANEVLYGADRRCALSLSLLAEVLANRGMKILHKRVDGHRAVVTCERP